MADTAEYTVTERAGRRVAGRVVQKDDVLELTPAEAEHGLREGTLVPKGKELAKAFIEETKTTGQIQAEVASLPRTPVRTGAAAVTVEAEEAQAKGGRRPAKADAAPAADPPAPDAPSA